MISSDMALTLISRITVSEPSRYLRFCFHTDLELIISHLRFLVISDERYGQMKAKISGEREGRAWNGTEIKKKMKITSNLYNCLTKKKKSFNTHDDS